MGAIRLSDFDFDGKLDWQAYRKARTANGEVCLQELCGGLTFKATGQRELCDACAHLEKDAGEVEHNSLLRCPKCGEVQSAFEQDSSEILADGQHDVICDSCEAEFEITTHVSFSFTSPEKTK